MLECSDSQSERCFRANWLLPSVLTERIQALLAEEFGHYSLSRIYGQRAESQDQSLRKCIQAYVLKPILFFIYLCRHSLPAPRTNSSKELKQNKKSSAWTVATICPYLNSPNGPRRSWSNLTDFSSYPPDYDSLGKCSLQFLEPFQALTTLKGPQGREPSLDMILGEPRCWARLSFGRLKREPEPGWVGNTLCWFHQNSVLHRWPSWQIVMVSFCPTQKGFFFYKTLWFLQKILAKVSNSCLI